MSPQNTNWSSALQTIAQNAGPQDMSPGHGGPGGRGLWMRGRWAPAPLQPGQLCLFLCHTLTSGRSSIQPEAKKNFFMKNRKYICVVQLGRHLTRNACLNVFVRPLKRIPQYPIQSSHPHCHGTAPRKESSGPSGPFVQGKSKRLGISAKL